MTTAYFKIQIREVIASSNYFNFKFVILPKNIYQRNKKTIKLQRAYRECLGTKRR